MLPELTGQGSAVENYNPSWVTLTLPFVLLSLWTGNTGGHATLGVALLQSTARVFQQGVWRGPISLFRGHSVVSVFSV